MSKMSGDGIVILICIALVVIGVVAVTIISNARDNKGELFCGENNLSYESNTGACFEIIGDTYLEYSLRRSNKQLYFMDGVRT